MGFEDLRVYARRHPQRHPRRGERGFSGRVAAPPQARRSTSSTAATSAPNPSSTPRRRLPPRSSGATPTGTARPRRGTRRIAEHPVPRRPSASSSSAASASPSRTATTSRLVRRVLDEQEHDYLLVGHTHVKEDRRVGRVRMINPGALTARRRKRLRRSTRRATSCGS